MACLLLLKQKGLLIFQSCFPGRRSRVGAVPGVHVQYKGSRLERSGKSNLLPMDTWREVLSVRALIFKCSFYVAAWTRTGWPLCQPGCWQDFWADLAECF